MNHNKDILTIFLAYIHQWNPILLVLSWLFVVESIQELFIHCRLRHQLVSLDRHRWSPLHSILLASGQKDCQVVPTYHCHHPAVVHAALPRIRYWLEDFHHSRMVRKVFDCQGILDDLRYILRVLHHLLLPEFGLQHASQQDCPHFRVCWLSRRWQGW